MQNHKALPPNWYAIDIETEAKPGAPEDGALHHKHNYITQIAISDGVTAQAAPPEEMRQRLNEIISSGGKFVAYNGKFDFKSLLEHGYISDINCWAGDAYLMVRTVREKVPDGYVNKYEAERQRLADSGQNWHRKAGANSLKVTAPYFLGVPPFWEKATHNDSEYAAMDALYTAQLFVLLKEQLLAEDSFSFYHDRFLEWNKLLLEAEFNGVTINLSTMSRLEDKFSEIASNMEHYLRDLWRTPIAEYQYREEEKIRTLSGVKLAKRLGALKDKSKIPATKMRYKAALEESLKKLEPFNLNSTSQVKWLFTEGLGLHNIKSTDKATLEDLVSAEVPGAEEFLKYRQASKLCSAFFPSYRDKAVSGKIYAQYRIDGTRTGRLSSASPNLQQISKEILPIFTATPGKLLVYRDISAVEPRLTAYVTESEPLCNIFLRGTDFHSENVRVMLGINEPDDVIKRDYHNYRDLSKKVGLSLMYGASFWRIMQGAKEMGFNLSEDDCRDIYGAFKTKYKEVWGYKNYLEGKIRRGEPIKNILGRPLTFEEDRIEMQSLNTVIQSSGSDILLDSVYKAMRQLKGEGIMVTPLLFIHDSFTCEVEPQHAEHTFKVLGEQIASWKLSTQYGNIPLKSEGYVGEYLTKDVEMRDA